MLLAGGILGTASGVWLFTLLRSLDMLDLLIALSYVILLGSVGALMVTESLRAIVRTRQGKPIVLRRPGSHTWLHGLPIKLRFKRSKIYVSAIPVWMIGFIIGFVGAVMGIGGGFLLVPAMIYLLGMPTALVAGTSLFQIIFTTAIATFLQAALNNTVDVMLALLLLVGGVVGAQFGTKASGFLRGEQARALLALLVVGVALRLAVELVVPPPNLYSITVPVDR
jgi:uncharacterized protein